MIKEYIDFLKENIKNNNYARYGVTFKTKNRNYFYDSGTNKVFECEENEYKVLEYILTKSSIDAIEEISLSETELIGALNNIKTMIEVENIFKLPSYDKFVTQEESREESNDKISQIIFELTEACNLRCKYCIYDDSTDKFRNFSKDNMSWKTAKKAIDFAINNSSDKLSLTFYGGEPLLQYDLMKKCIDYSKESVGDSKKLSFGFTSNLTLLTKEQAEYFSSLGSCSITGSIDGPKEIHDENRLTINKKGSYDNAVKGLRLLIDVYGQERSKELININAVIAPPYNEKKIEDVYEFFNSLDWLPEGLMITTSYVDEAQDETNEYKMDYAKAFYSNPLDVTDPLNYFKLQKICSNQNGNVLFGDDVRLIKMHKRMVVDEPIPFLLQNGCCTPGSRRLYVTTQGDFKVCERIGNSPSIGNVETGINQSAINQYYIADYCNESIKDCSSCWAVHLCSLCFVGFYKEYGINIGKKRQVCYAQRCRAKNDLLMYHQLMEEAPEYIEKLDLVQLQ